MKFETSLLNPNGRFEIFNYQNLGRVRVQLDNQGNPWFCLNDVLSILQIGSVSNVKDRLHPKGVDSINVLTNGGPQNMIFVDEGNLYMAIGRSRKPEAVPFMEWVYREVLPMIRKTGMYMTDEMNTFLMNNPNMINQIIRDYNRIKEENDALNSYAREKDGQINELWDKLAEYEDIDDDDEDYC